MITYFELLQMIKEGRQPKRVLYGGFVWEWSGRNYKRKITFSKEVYLNANIAEDYSEYGFVNNKAIELLPDVPGGKRSI